MHVRSLRAHVSREVARIRTIWRFVYVRLLKYPTFSQRKSELTITKPAYKQVNNCGKYTATELCSLVESKRKSIGRFSWWVDIERDQLISWIALSSEIVNIPAMTNIVKWIRENSRLSYNTKYTLFWSGPLYYGFTTFGRVLGNQGEAIFEIEVWPQSPVSISKNPSCLQVSWNLEVAGSIFKIVKSF